MKFGGTSVGTPQRIKNVAGLIADGKKKIVVLSAMSGTTNALSGINDYLFSKNKESAYEAINALEEQYLGYLDELYSTEEYRKLTEASIKEIFNTIRTVAKGMFTICESKVVIGQGEIISTTMMTNYLEEQGVKVCLIPALDFMKTDKNCEPDALYIRKNLNDIMETNPDYDLYITQGFICRNAYGEMDNLLRGSSDYTASLVGAAVDAEEIQIWTDIDGMHNNDPRFVRNTQPVHNLHFEEAAELAYFGAKILHPTCILPAKHSGIPVKILNTMDPTAQGTVICNKAEKQKIKAVAAKDGITVINIISSRMLLAYGFLAEVFNVFKANKTSIDVICTSEVGVSISIDNDEHLSDIEKDLKKFGSVKIDRDMCVICVVGDLDWTNVGLETEVTEAMRDIPVRMISYGGSNYNISYVIRAEDKQKALQSLSNHLFA